MITTNYGINRHAGARADRNLDVPEYVESMRAGPDGYTDMTTYNNWAPWSGETKQLIEADEHAAA